MTINTIAEALKKLYAKLGGTDNVADVPTVAEMIDKVTEVAGGGGGGLPEVTAADNGKVLSVVNGEWDAAEAPSGGSSIIKLYSDGYNLFEDFEASSALSYDGLHSLVGAGFDLFKPAIAIELPAMEGDYRHTYYLTDIGSYSYEDPDTYDQVYTFTATFTGAIPNTPSNNAPTAPSAPAYLFFTAANRTAALTKAN